MSRIDLQKAIKELYPTITAEKLQELESIARDMAELAQISTYTAREVLLERIQDEPNTYGI